VRGLPARVDVKATSSSTLLGHMRLKACLAGSDVCPLKKRVTESRAFDFGTPSPCFDVEREMAIASSEVPIFVEAPPMSARAETSAGES
jgi:hypothetical protein